jgi:hypothetical protein
MSPKGRFLRCGRALPSSGKSSSGLPSPSGTSSQSKGAEILRVSRAEFVEILARYRVSPFQNDEDDLADLAARA